MADRSLARSTFRLAVLMLLVAGQVTGTGAPFLSSTSALAASKPQRMGGTWDLTWKSRRGNMKTGYMVVEQRGAQLFAEVYDRGGATATGSIAGTTFTLRGSRLAIPFTVTGRIKGRRMTGTLSALGTERHFTGIRRGRR